jgi:hypothetical protein
MKQFVRKLFGIDKLLAEKEQAQLETTKAKEDERIAKLAPKERATARGEPWVSVLDTKVNKDNPRNGFFELDWNDLFIVQLKQAGYGYDGDPDEQIVDRWFRDLYSSMIQGEGMEAKDRTAGYVNVTRLGNNRAQIE